MLKTMASPDIPSHMKQVIVNKFGKNFRECTEIVQVPVPSPGPGQALVRTSYVSINAADMLFIHGLYVSQEQLPLVNGFEGMGEVVSLGEGSSRSLGQTVFVRGLGGTFSEYVIIDNDIMEGFPLDSADPDHLSLFGSGTTAYIAFDKKAPLKQGDKVMVTAAAGATGMFAIQLAKLAGCHVIGTCSTEEKASFLTSLGCDRPIVYTKESVDDVLTKEYPEGIDVVYECIGDEMFTTCLNHLAVFGKILVIGAIAQYQRGEDYQRAISPPAYSSLALRKSADIRGFFLCHYFDVVPEYILKLRKLMADGQLKIFMDNGNNSENGPFKGIEKIYDGLDHMFNKKNTGKIYVQIAPDSLLNG